MASMKMSENRQSLHLYLNSVFYYAIYPNQFQFRLYLKKKPKIFNLTFILSINEQMQSPE